MHGAWSILPYKIAQDECPSYVKMLTSDLMRIAIKDHGQRPVIIEPSDFFKEWAVNYNLKYQILFWDNVSEWKFIPANDHDMNPKERWTINFETESDRMLYALMWK